MCAHLKQAFFSFIYSRDADITSNVSINSVSLILHITKSGVMNRSDWVEGPIYFPSRNIIKPGEF